MEGRILYSSLQISKKGKGMPHAVQASTGTGLGTMPCPTVPLGAIRVAQGLLMAPSSVLVSLPLL